jgi:ribosomal protein S18 acetylase RimI-like enzyme
MTSQDTEDPSGKRRRPEIDIREMEIEDLAAVFQLGEKLFRASEVPILYRSWEEFEVLDSFVRDMGYSYVADLDGEIVGFALGSVVTKRKSAWKYGYLAWLGVKPEFQRFGIATRLFREIRDAMLEDGKAILEKSPLLVKDVEARIDENDTVNICYTSGTTGNKRRSSTIPGLSFDIIGC